MLKYVLPLYGYNPISLKYQFILLRNDKENFCGFNKLHVKRKEE